MNYKNISILYLLWDKILTSHFYASKIIRIHMQIKKSEYIHISRILVNKLYDETCYGKGSLYIETIQQGFPRDSIDKVEAVLEALVKQDICRKKKKGHGWKYYLNMERYDKIKEILKEKGTMSAILLILLP
jgi:hypothetical protein